MRQEPNIAVDFAGIRLANPVLTASGTCGYADELADWTDLQGLGGFITKSITPLPRKGNPPPRIVETDAGMLNAIGLANVGLDRFIDEKLPLLRRMTAPVFVNVAGESVEDYVQVVERLAHEKAVAGFELNISCPNVKKGGITFGTDPCQVRQITAAIRQVADKKVLMVKLPPAVTDITVTARAAVEGGAHALSLVNTFTAMVVDVETRRPVLANRTGGLSGPAIRPIAVYLVSRVYRDVARDCGVPILGLGGIRTASDALEFILAGASAVAVGTGTFVDPTCAGRIVEGVRDYCTRHRIADIRELIGSLE
ncbi:MAG: dihydroorotate dehydrogenase [Phycisphaerae bacterium]|nr:dihydroorotate dehydrogenase [Phycisphaerae bacterium]